MCKIKKMLAIVLALLMTFSMFAGMGTVSKADNGTDLFIYEIKDQTVTITGYTDLCSGDIVIPDTIEGYPVTKIGDDAFANCKTITAVTIPDGVTTIGKNAFSRARKLKTVIFPDSLTSIESMAFFSSGIEGIILPASVTDIAVDAFACASIESIKLPDGITETLNFNGSGLKNIFIPASVKKIDKGSFSNVQSLTDIYYAGSKEDWNNIEFEEFLSYDTFENVTIHYSSCNEIVIQPKNNGNSINAVKKDSVFAAAVKGYKYTVVDAYGKELAADSLVGTGCIVKLYDADKELSQMKQIVVQYDVNGDGQITAADARLALRASADLEKISGVYAIAANVNGDDDITASDARKILRRSAGLE